MAFCFMCVLEGELAADEWLASQGMYIGLRPQSERVMTMDDV